MDRIHIFTQYSINSERKRLIYVKDILGAIIVFLLGRVIFFDAIAPFALAFLSAYITNNKTVSWKYVAVALLGLLGIATSGADIATVKYLLAFVLFGLIYVSVTTLTDSRKDFTVSGMAGVAMLISGIIFSAQTGFVLYDIFMLILESVCCVVSALLMQISLPLVSSRKGRASYEELAGLYMIAVLCILGLSNIKIGSIAFGNSLAAVLIMLMSLISGMPGGAVGGVGIGVIYGMSNFPLTEVVGVYSFCGLVAGTMRKFNKAGVILAFFIANSALSLYLGGFKSGVFGILELTFAVVVFCLIPKSAIIELESMISVGKASNDTIRNSLKFITQKLNSVATSFSSLAETFSGIVHPENCDNYADITTLFDKTADKVCRRCGLKFICWEKEFNSTYDSMMKIAPVLRSKEKVKVENITEPFKSKCIKIDEFLSELNRVYGKHKLDMQWQQKVIESKELAAEQFFGMSKIMDNLVSEIGNSIEFDSRLEKRLIVEIEHAGIKKCDVTVLKNCFGRYEVSVRLKKCANGLSCEETIIPIVSEVIGREMDKRDFTCAKEEEECTRCEIYLVEKEKYSVLCGSARRIKDGQIESGDNFNYMPIGDGKYVLVLSDGMGSGKQAASQSNTTVTMLKQLLTAGFDKQSAVKIINSALLIKSTEECFATIDIVILDLFSGETEFIKIGANSTFIKQDKKVDQINSSTLPAGILSSVDVETSSKKINTDDYIIMISDGIHSAADNWIKDFIIKLDNLGPQWIADEVLKEAIKRKKDYIDDDMTVIAAKISQRIA